MAEKKIIIKAETLFDGKSQAKNKLIVIEGNKIVDVTDASKRVKADYKGIVTPAFIDAHSHIGMCREGEPSQEEECNEITDQILPLCNPLNSIYFDDRAFSDAVDFGILYSCVVPGSGNLIGGKAVIIKNFAQNRKDALLKDYGFKMALGFNPRSTTDWKGARPKTRMGAYSLLEKAFDDVLNKEKKIELVKLKKEEELHKKRANAKITDAEFEKDMRMLDAEFELKFSSEEKALLEILHRKKVAKVHVHKEDDVLYLIELAVKYNLLVTADHACDVFHKDIFDELGKESIPVVYGPLGCLGYKVELKHSCYQNALLLMQSRVLFGLMTDHPVIHATALRDSLKFFMIQGMAEKDAISLITSNNAWILSITDMLGTIEKGKLASLLVWDKDPLHLGALPTLVLGEGKILRKR